MPHARQVAEVVHLSCNRRDGFTGKAAMPLGPEDNPNLAQVSKRPLKQGTANTFLSPGWLLTGFLRSSAPPLCSSPQAPTPSGQALCCAKARWSLKAHKGKPVKDKGVKEQEGSGRVASAALDTLCRGSGELRILLSWSALGQGSGLRSHAGWIWVALQLEAVSQLTTLLPAGSLLKGSGAVPLWATPLTNGFPCTWSSMAYSARPCLPCLTHLPTRHPATLLPRSSDKPSFVQCSGF